MAGSPLIPRSAVLLAALLASGCLSFRYERDRADLDPAVKPVDALVPGRSDLDEILGSLGAPLDVWEGPRGEVVLAYGGLDSAGWKLDVTVYVSNDMGPSFSYTDVAARTRGVVLILDRDLVLRMARRGFLADLRAQTE